MSYCSKTNCKSRAVVVLAYDYGGRTVTLSNLGDERPSPHVYVLCGPCADKLTPPRGWELIDHRVVVLNDWLSGVAGLRTASGSAGPGPVQVA